MKVDVPSRTESPLAAVMSLLFWGCLLIASGLYGATALAPPFLNYLQLSREHFDNQVRLVALEQQVDELERVQQALENDAQFARELARIDFDAARPGEERIGVEPALRLGSEDSTGLLSPRVSPRPWYTSSVEIVAIDGELRMMMLTTAAILVLLAFTFLQGKPSFPWWKLLRGHYNPLRLAVERYGSTETDVDNVAEDD